jgi:hypothetical protein
MGKCWYTSPVMSSLIFCFSEHEIIVATDTLAVADQRGIPCSYTTKFHPVPHIRGIICGTGDGQFLGQSFLIANSLPARDILELSHILPEALRLIHSQRYQDLISISTSTIYHFGFPIDGTAPVGIKYPSENDFVPHELPRNQIGMKPAGDIITDNVFSTRFLLTMRSQIESENKKPQDQRVYIGGQVTVCHMTREETKITCPDLFSDWSENFDVMMQNFPK